MYWNLIILIAVSVFFPVFLIAINAFFFIPKLIQSMQKLKQTGEPKDFSALIFYGFISFLVFSPAYAFTLQTAFRFYRPYSLLLYAEVSVIFILALLVFRLFCPKTLVFYKKYKETGGKAHLFLLTLCSFLSFVILSLIFLVLIASHLGGVSVL